MFYDIRHYSISGVFDFFLKSRRTTKDQLTCQLNKNQHIPSLLNPNKSIFLGYLLCKSCGEDSSVLNLIDNSRISDFNLGLSNITIGSKEVLVQDLKNPRGINFRVLISKRAHCAKTSGVRLRLIPDFKD